MKVTDCYRVLRIDANFQSAWDEVLIIIRTTLYMQQVKMKINLLILFGKLNIASPRKNN